VSKETDQLAEAEQIRALLYLGDAASVAALDAHLPRAQFNGVESYLEWLVLTRPEKMADRLESILKRPSANPWTMSALVGRAIALNAAGHGRPLHVWLQTATPAAWREALDALGADISDADASAIQQALASENQAIRQQTVWSIVGRLARGTRSSRSGHRRRTPAARRVFYGRKQCGCGLGTVRQGARCPSPPSGTHTG
jgi:hypothetical protein